MYLKKVIFAVFSMVTSSVFAQSDFPNGIPVTNGRNLFLRAAGSSAWDAGDLIFERSNGTELARIHTWEDNSMVFGRGPNIESTMVLSGNANVGIGATAPVARLQVVGPLGDDYSIGTLVLGEATGAHLRMGNHQAYSWIQSHAGNPLYLNSVGNHTILNLNAGNVGIGYASPQEKLAVKGAIRAESIKVEINNWPDYVFSEKYELKPLREIESYISKHEHLPGIPTASEVDRKVCH